MSEDYHPRNLSDLLRVIKSERKNLEYLISQLSDSQKVQPGVVGNWSIKDVMAHIAAWEKLAHDRINAALTGESLKYPVIEGDDFVDNFNHQVYEKNKDLSLEVVQDDFDRSYKEFLHQIQSLDDGTLTRKLPFDWAGNRTVQILISANTHWHYVEHAESITNWIANLNIPGKS
jgi:hypothetical protein